jgi:hypothetical protein
VITEAPLSSVSMGELVAAMREVVWDLAIFLFAAAAGS